MADTTPSTNEITMSTIATQVKELLIAASNTSTPAWLDRLPTEVRLEIFKLAQQHKNVLLVVDDKNHKLPVDVSLLVALVNDKKNIEAVEAFYTVNTFRLTTYAQLASSNLGLADGVGDAFDYITSLELRNLAVHDEFMGSDGLRLARRIREQMPKLKNIVIAIDTIPGYVPFSEAINPTDGYEMHCVGVGRYRMSKKEGLAVDFVHAGLVEAWQKMLDAKPETFREQADAFEKAIDRNDQGIKGHVEFFLNISLARWVAVWEKGVKLILGPDHAKGPPADMTPAELFILQIYGKLVSYCKTSAAAKVYGTVVSGQRLRDLDVGSPLSSPEVLEGITDILRVNSMRSPLLTSGGPKYRREKAGNLGQIFEVDKDGKTVSEAMVNVAASAQAGSNGQ
ncbi:hypothetical protein LTR10_023511 [Elasticomyces elasticus]|nr:hypothetical protein LTR10_023511 [Elasticomyces elasticus]KAK4979379.1 hypothetical protein LTR42_001882 [Elasticomyces elasticus]